MKVVYATATTSVRGPRGPVQLVWGQHWPASDPVVAAYPDLFTEDPTPGLRVSQPLEEVPVEQATAAPGEKRTTRRSA